MEYDVDLFFALYHIFIEYDTRYYQYQTYIGGGYNLLAQDGRDEEEREEG